ncbi:KdsC family phosphatase [Thermogemmata fonticola]|jgi:3-deoxy-D-manno-octulosonate 8-phosphate phosphatase (KDO 8-P phosphatase)|uniref:HAD hydrolase family protein n=1 Tax=Thermogemmata fonticola TaxID=2755323 RepID=A0A7V9AAY9_9BACT|nr:HAD hydrolase family protein [Thermogemmata fonticola]MBA2225636.1 HAD hydrolase family protein [Thermogemmata fonticola]
MDELSPPPHPPRLPLQQRIGRIRCLVLDVDGVLTDGRLYYTAEGEQAKTFHVRDGSALRLWKLAGGCAVILSGRSSPAVACRAQELSIDVVRQGLADKASVLPDVCRALQVELSEMCAVGDDWLDVPLLQRVGVAAAPADACPEVLQRVDYVTPSRGGQGVIRDLVEWLLRQQGKWENTLARAWQESEGVKRGEHSSR